MQRRSDTRSSRTRPPARARRAFVIAASIVAVTTVIVACSGGTPSSTGGTVSPASAGAPEPGSAWQGVLSQVNPDGTVPLATALAAFILSVGPLPGVATPPGTAGTILDGTAGVRWVIGRWNDLTPSQQAAINTYLVTPARAQASGQPGAGDVQLVSDRRPKVPPRLVGAPSASGYLATAQHFRSLIAADLGRDTPQDLKVVVNAKQRQGATALAYTDTFDSGWGYSGKAAHCVVYINPLLYNSRDSSLVTSTLAHEVFHCFQADDYPNTTAWGGAPPWLIEGQAEWVGETLEPTADPLWDPYLAAVSTALFSRKYDAIGFYSHMAESGINPWTRLDAMLKAPGNAAAYATAVNDAFRADWASSLARQPALGAGWDTTGPGITSTRYTPTVTDLGNGTTVSKSVAPYTNALVETNITADVVAVSVTGNYARLHAADGAEYDGADLHNAEFCVSNCNQNACVSALKRLAPGPTWLAVGGDTSGASYTISGRQSACACVIGYWVVTNEVIKALGVSGGAGARWSISPNGLITIDWGVSMPLTGRGISIRYNGQEMEHTTLPTDPTQTSGTWTLSVVGGQVTATTDAYGVRTTRRLQEAFNYSATGTWMCQGNFMTTGYAGTGETVMPRRA